ncbi:MAG: N,N-dimethylformamidase beta subunit family domain-containing protein [Steroidobacteraceae bacterium]
MLRLVGYADRLSVAPGETLQILVHAEPGISRYQARIVRLVCGDLNPDGPGFKTEPLASAIDGFYPARQQITDAGSYVRIPHARTFPRLSEFSVGALVFPTRVDGEFSAIVAKWCARSCRGWALGLDKLGRPVLRLGDGERVFDAVAPQALPLRQWAAITASVHARSVVVSIEALGAPAEAYAMELPFAAAFGSDADLLVAGLGRGDRVDHHFNGKIERPCLFAAAIDHAAVAAVLRDGGCGHRALLAAWDFAQEIASTTVRDIGPHAFHGVTVNLPTRAVTGHRWNGSEMNWTRRPDHYAAIHFHDDDLYDAGWSPDFAWQVPKDWPSGIYAAHLSAGEHSDYVPFVVRPARPGSTAAVALLVPTASYIAYANDRCALHGSNPEVLASRVLTLAPGDVYLSAHPQLGLSLYDTHSDGSGVCYSSRLRPILNMRPGHVAWQGGLGSGLWNFNADLHITDWLAAIGQPYEAVTDEDLHREGAALLGAYRVVITGTHPEYYSARMHDAVTAYCAGGGRLMYLGGNGFYWRIAFHPELPGAIEVRRAEDGNRSWASAPGEYYQSFDGCYGGLWRRNGRPPQALVGVGYSCQGFNVSRPYRRTAASRDPCAAFIFDGISDDAPIGDVGLNGGGAAGIELDRADPLLGTPPEALVIATADDLPDSYILANEEVLTTRPTIFGSLSPLVRADMVFWPNRAGGAVFATGSIAWCGALAPNAYDNTVARITGNVLRRFIDLAPFEE